MSGRRSGRFHGPAHVDQEDEVRRRAFVLGHFVALEGDADQPVVRVPGAGRAFEVDGEGAFVTGRGRGVVVGEIVEHFLDADGPGGRQAAPFDEPAHDGIAGGVHVRRECRERVLLRGEERRFGDVAVGGGVEGVSRAEIFIGCGRGGWYRQFWALSVLDDYRLGGTGCNVSRITAGLPFVHLWLRLIVRQLRRCRGDATGSSLCPGHALRAGDGRAVWFCDGGRCVRGLRSIGQQRSRRSGGRAGRRVRCARGSQQRRSRSGICAGQGRNGCHRLR